MTYTEKVQHFIDEPLCGFTEIELRERVSTDLARTALAHPPQEFLIEKFAKDHGYADDDARALFEDVKKFLLLGSLVDASPAPSLPIDQMWHAFILFTKDYAEFCGKVGGFIHHRPLPSTSEHQPPIEPTLELMTAAYGPLSETSWPAPLGAFGIMDCKAGV
ncbi:glycine-rich domain-containing protein [Nocardia sp. NPDC060249]|uniref:glycine-rich domain-containing protein n=1 Tax=Nocardia sp. NPDC060249 TaxID=3347082 RepID=UPI00365A5256